MASKNKGNFLLICTTLVADCSKPFENLSAFTAPFSSIRRWKTSFLATSIHASHRVVGNTPAY